MHFVHQFLRFVAVGIVGTAAHYAILIALVEFAQVDSAGASSLGFLAGAIVNYHLNRTLTFKSPVKMLSGLPKFFFIALVGAVMNVAIMIALTQYTRFHYLVIQLVATCVVLIWNFLGNRHWTFADASEIY